MLTALNIITPEKRSFFSNLLSVIRGNTIKVQHLYFDSVALKSITYTQNRKKINWNAIDKFTKEQRTKLLCCENMILPKDKGYRRYESFELNSRLCTNLALYLLKNISHSENLTVGLIDDNALYDELGFRLVDFTDKVYIFTKKHDAYIPVTERLLDEKGAVITVTKNLGKLKFCDLVIAPELIKMKLPLSENALVLTSQKPVAETDALTLYNYFFDLPKKYLSVKPDYLDDMYFASALYSLLKIYKLGSFVPRLCSGNNDIHTPSSLCNVLKKQ